MGSCDHIVRRFEKRSRALLFVASVGKGLETGVQIIMWFKLWKSVPDVLGYTIVVLHASDWIGPTTNLYATLHARHDRRQKEDSSIVESVHWEGYQSKTFPSYSIFANCVYYLMDLQCPWKTDSILNWIILCEEMMWKSCMVNKPLCWSWRMAWNSRPEHKYIYWHLRYSLMNNWSIAFCNAISKMCYTMRFKPNSNGIVG